MSNTDLTKNQGMSMAAIKEIQRTIGSPESVSLTCLFIQFVFNQVYIIRKKTRLFEKKNSW
jgi:hypothetical protein